jgi:hypothetical protein
MLLPVLWILSFQFYIHAILPFHYRNVINNGHTVQVNIQSGSTLTIEGETYELKQFHFHTPSENNINGTSYPLEAQHGKFFIHIFPMTWTCRSFVPPMCFVVRALMFYIL